MEKALAAERSIVARQASVQELAGHLGRCRKESGYPFEAAVSVNSALRDFVWSAEISNRVRVCCGDEEEPCTSDNYSSLLISGISCIADAVVVSPDSLHPIEACSSGEVDRFEMFLKQAASSYILLASSAAMGRHNLVAVACAGYRHELLRCLADILSRAKDGRLRRNAGPTVARLARRIVTVDVQKLPPTERLLRSSFGCSVARGCFSRELAGAVNEYVAGRTIRDPAHAGAFHELDRFSRIIAPVLDEKMVMDGQESAVGYPHSLTFVDEHFLSAHPDQVRAINEQLNQIGRSSGPSNVLA